MDLGKLINNNLCELGRAADLLWLSIGNPRVIDIKYNNGTVKKKEVRDYAIHLQCAWRFVHNGRILLASQDIYKPYDRALDYDDDWHWDVFNREREQGSIYDAHSNDLKNNFLPLKIKNIYYTGTHDLHIDFDKGVTFDTFMSTSILENYEFYRIIDFETDEHTVIFEDEEDN